MRLQFLLAKVVLSERETRDALRLLEQVGDWRGLVETAGRKFSLPLLNYHLRRLSSARVPKDVLGVLAQGARGATFHNLALFASQKKFQDRVLGPEAVTGIFFKGVSIAARYYPAIGLRPCRDIDVLVHEDHVRRILERAVEEGFIPVSPDHTARPLISPRDLDTQIDLTGGAILLSPDGHVVDLQSRLDKHSSIFADYDVFARSETVVHGQQRFEAFPQPFLFNYLAHHHARHTWSRLHWLSDLDALVSSATFDRDESLCLADALGQRGNVEAALELRELMSTKASWNDTAERDRGKAFLRMCISNLSGDLELEKRISLHLKGGEFMFDWQASPDLVARARRRRRTGVLRPTVTQYAAFPLPRALRWLYFIPRVFVLARNTIARR